MTSLTAAQARDAAVDRFVTSWSGTPAANVTIENEPTHLDKGSAPWVRMGVRHEPRGNDGQSTLGRVGGRRYLREITIWVQLFSLVKDGMVALDALAQEARAIFEGASFSGIRCFDGTFRESGVDGDWQMGMVEVVGDYQEIK